MEKVKTQAELDKLIKENSGEWVEVGEGGWVVSGQLKIELRDNSSAVLWGNSSAELWGNSRAELWGNSRAVLWGNSSAEVANHALAIIRSDKAKAMGNQYCFTDLPKTVTDWLANYKVKANRGFVILYKATDENFGTQKGVIYTIGAKVLAPDWEDTTKIECGQALHFCPLPFLCDQFRAPKHYVACRVAVKDLRIFDGIPTYPDKLRAKQCKVLYECDRDGTRIQSSSK